MQNMKMHLSYSMILAYILKNFLQNNYPPLNNDELKIHIISG